MYAEAKPSDLKTWTYGRPVMATGSPFNPFTYVGITYDIGQANNSLLYAGLGLGTIVARACHTSDGMLATAAEAECPARLESTNIIQKVKVAMWQPIYEQLNKEDL